MLNVKILVTGGAGFIGSNFVDALINEGYEVAVVDNLSTGKKENLNSLAKFYNVDIRDTDAIRSVFQEFRPEIVCHLAAQIDLRKSVANPSFDAEVNVVSSTNLFKLAVDSKVKRIIFSSTGGALYGQVDEIPADEDTPIKPICAYGVAKYCAEQYLDYFKRLYGVESVVLRYANVYGPRQDPLDEAGVVAIFTGKILRGEPITIFGDGNQTRDYVYIEDIVKANLLALNGEEGIYNIGTGVETSVNELVQIFEKLLGKKIIPVYAAKRQGEVDRIALDIAKAKKELGFEPKYNVEEGIKKTIEWYKKTFLE